MSDKYKVPLDGRIVELASGRQLVPGEVEKLSKSEAEDNKDMLAEAVKEGRLLEVVPAKTEGGDNK